MTDYITCRCGCAVGSPDCGCADIVECDTCGATVLAGEPCQRCEPEIYRQWMDTEIDLELAFRRSLSLPPIDECGTVDESFERLWGDPDEDEDDGDLDITELYTPRVA